MDEYIDREAAIAKCREIATCEWNHRASPVSWADAYEQFAEDIEEIPAADVAPVVYGRWAHLGGDEWCCSVCGFVITTEGSWVKPAKKYCEDCGAKMDGGEDL